MDFIKRHIISAISNEIDKANIPNGAYIYLYDEIDDDMVKVKRLNKWGYPICDKRGYGVSLISIKPKSVYKIYKQIKKLEYYYY